ncbi:hypothetical protein GLP25_04490 [Photobacterium phosphoreum]|uniref:hypothetical protein n=1 Tax=Photobacterium phosphoreum TaxID=659 RepID=UPI001E492CB7|nr:hypothetical protein [Photobacterium phosphoreum]MCD9482448.1 hypothetical protein [Photobacterium phosphoreum]
MQDLPIILQQINNCFGMSIVPVSNQFPRNQLYLESHLYNRILENAESRFGQEVLQFGISPENYMRYKNGKVSSIVKGDSGFQSHEGFEAVKMVSLVDSIFGEVSQYYTNQILMEFQELTNNIFTSINHVQSTLFNQALYLKEQEYVEDLVSFQDFFNEINDELGDISNSSARCTAYVGSLIEIRKKIYKTYNYFIKNLNDWPRKILSQDNFGNYFQIDYQSLNNDYCLCRQAINCYMITLVYEYVISGNVDDRSRDKIIKKIESFLDKFRSADSQIKYALFQRDSSNKNWYWYYRQDKQNDSNSIGWFLNQLSQDQNFEITKVKEVFNRSKELLSSIELIEYKPK